MILDFLKTSHKTLPASFKSFHNLQSKKEGTIKILFGEGDTPGFKKFKDHFDVFTCLPSTMGKNGEGYSYLNHNQELLEKEDKSNSVLFIIMDMYNENHVQQFVNLFEHKVSVCKVNLHGIGPSLDYIYQMLTKDGIYYPTHFQDKLFFNNYRVFEKFLEKNTKKNGQIFKNETPFNVRIEFSQKNVIRNYIEIFTSQILDFLELYPYFEDRLLNIQIKNIGTLKQTVQENQKHLEFLIKLLTCLHYGFKQMISFGLTPVYEVTNKQFNFYWTK
jgi:hypothetical protein